MFLPVFSKSTENSIWPKCQIRPCCIYMMNCLTVHIRNPNISCQHKSLKLCHVFMLWELLKWLQQRNKILKHEFACKLHSTATCTFFSPRVSIFLQGSILLSVHPASPPVPTCEFPGGPASFVMRRSSGPVDFWDIHNV